MADVRPCLQVHVLAREHVQHARFLDVATVLEDDAAPVAAKHSARPHIAVLANGDVTNHRGLRVHVRRRVDDRHHALECIDHQDDWQFLMTVAYPWPTPMHRVTKP